MIESRFSRHFFPKLPNIVRNDVKCKIEARKNRGNASRENLHKYSDDAVRFGLKRAHFIENKFSFVDTRNGANNERLSHHILMNDQAIKKLAAQISDENNLMLVHADSESATSFLALMWNIYQEQSNNLRSVHLNAPFQDVEKIDEEMLSIAVLKMQTEVWIEKRLLKLRAQYIEYAQIALERVGTEKHQTKYISAMSFSNWKIKQREAEQFVKNMTVFNDETGERYALADVVKRTTSNPENRRIEMMVRSRGFEELATELGYTALFITWTLPSKYHRVSSKWNGASVKEGHNKLMSKWAIARAQLSKLDIKYFGFRVAEPHKDATSHGHYFLFCHADCKDAVIDIIKSTAIAEDRYELGDDISPRFDVKECDPEKGGATAYIAKYISKNINGNHMPESKAQEGAFMARAWASTHGIRQFQQFGGSPVSLWRNLRKAKPQQTLIDSKLEELRQAADSSKWKLFCQLASSAKIEYEKKKNKYGETVSKIIGFSWLGKVIETASEHYSLIKTKDVARHALALDLKKKRSFAPWSTENNCNQALKQMLSDTTGWSLDGVQCLIKPLLMGGKVPIDKHQTLCIRNNRLIAT
ncbi:replication endonuclease [Aliivibrio kagoshimensis]|uniref:replication endonuclease n=1 Tax=Aliivibrio kagoshimensis TaxID=2910230 RepID=UPI003D1433E2